MSDEYADASSDVLDLADKILTDAADLTGTGIDRATWSLLETSGLTDLASSGEGSWADLAALLTTVGSHAARVPIAEHDVLAGWLLRTAGLPRSPGIATAGIAADGVGVNVPWAREADAVVLVGRGGDGAVRVWSTAPAQFKLTEAVNLAGEQRDTVHLSDGDIGEEVDSGVLEEFRLRLALCRAVQIAGAAGTVLDLTTRYASEREQFGRPIARFQSVQDLVSRMAAETVMVRAATDEAVARLRSSTWTESTAVIGVLIAASCAGHAASTIVRNAHQVLGAMGYTQEHALHRFTNRMLAWRNDAGPLHSIDARILREAQGCRPDELWALLIDTQSA